MFTQELSRFISRTRYEDLPGEVVNAARLAILDFIGVAMAGSWEPSARMVSELVRESPPSSEATVIGGRYKTGAALAALANGTAGHVLDYDDCLDFPDVGLGHPTTGILPAALAVSEKNHLSGRDLITAYCLGLEAYAKIGLLTREKRTYTGWEWTGVLGVMGAAAAVSGLLKLDENKTMMALGIASSLSSGLIRNFGTMAGHLHSGNAARNGVEAGLLAAKGFVSCSSIIEDTTGFYNTYTGSPDPLPEEAVREDLNQLGNPWNIINPGLMFKAYPCAHISHFGVYAALQLREKHSIDCRQIKEIEFSIPPFVQRAVFYNDPQTGVEGKFSLGYCLCRALIAGKIRITDFTDENVKDPVTRGLMNRIRWIYMEQQPPGGPFGYQEVVLKMNDGRVFSCRVEHPRGEPQNPMSREEFAAKYRDNALHARYDEAVLSRIKDLILDLENVEDIASITGLMNQ